MAIDEAERSESGGLDGGEDSDAATEGPAADEPPDETAVVGEYTWEEFMEEYGYSDQVDALYPDEQDPEEEVGLSSGDEVTPQVPTGEDWERVSFAPEEYLGFHPDDLESLIKETAAANANLIWDEEFWPYVDPERTPVVKDTWTWEQFKWEYYYEEDGSQPTTGDGEIDHFDPTEYLSFEPEETEETLNAASEVAKGLDDLIEDRTVDVREGIEEDDFFSDEHGNTTVVNRYDLEKAVNFRKKTHFQEEERYWVNKPYAFVIIFHSRKENEKKYYLVQPYLNEIETDLVDFLTGKLRTAIKYADEDIAAGADSTEEERKEVIERETKKLLRRYDLFDVPDANGDGSGGGFLDDVRDLFDLDDEEPAETEEDVPDQLDGMSARPEPAILEDDPETLDEYQVEKILYLLKRDFIGYERIDGIKHDINVEDVSCDGWNTPVFVYHSDYEQIITNVYHGKEELDDFVVKLAQRSGKGISKRRPQVDATLPDGSRAQLTLGREVSDHGTNYTIRQFKDVPFTPIDLINWNTFSLDEMAFLWLCIENHKSLIFAGGTASGKTTSLNAVSLFIPSNTKIVSIEDTREVELPQRNWVASVTRPSFSDGDEGDVDEFDLLEAALRQRPDYIVMGEIRGEEGRTLFQVMSTGHTTYTTFHADSVGEVLKRFTTDPINVSKTMFTALDLVSIQTQTRVQGHKVRRNKTLTEVNHYDAENDEINVQDVYQWQAETDEFLKLGDSNTLEEIKFDRGWNQERLEEELFKRELILAYLIKNGLNQYREVAATIQAFINDPDTILTLIANGQLEASLEDLREMESVLIDVDPEKEELVPRPDPDDEGYNLAMSIIEEAEESMFDEYRGRTPDGLESALGEEATAEPTIDPGGDEEFAFEGDISDEFGGEFTFGDDEGSPFDVGDEGEAAAETGDDPFEDGPEWLGGSDEDDDAEGADTDEADTEDGGAEPAGDGLDEGATGDEDMWADAREALEGEVESDDGDDGPSELPAGDPTDVDEEGDGEETRQESDDDAAGAHQESDPDSAADAGDAPAPESDDHAEAVDDGEEAADSEAAETGATAVAAAEDPDATEASNEGPDAEAVDSNAESVDSEEGDPFSADTPVDGDVDRDGDVSDDSEPEDSEPDDSEPEDDDPEDDDPETVNDGAADGPGVDNDDVSSSDAGDSDPAVANGSGGSSGPDVSAGSEADQDATDELEDDPDASAVDAQDGYDSIGAQSSERGTESEEAMEAGESAETVADADAEPVPDSPDGDEDGKATQDEPTSGSDDGTGDEAAGGFETKEPEPADDEEADRPSSTTGGDDEDSVESHAGVGDDDSTAEDPDVDGEEDGRPGVNGEDEDPFETGALAEPEDDVTSGGSLHDGPGGEDDGAVIGDDGDESTMDDEGTGPFDDETVHSAEDGPFTATEGATADEGDDPFDMEADETSESGDGPFDGGETAVGADDPFDDDSGPFSDEDDGSAFSNGDDSEGGGPFETDDGSLETDDGGDPFSDDGDDGNGGSFGSDDGDDGPFGDDSPSSEEEEEDGPFGDGDQPEDGGPFGRDDDESETDETGDDE